MATRPSRTRRYVGIVFLALSVWVGWLWLIINYQAGRVPVYEQTSANLEKAGQFGDAFGTIASLMATIAAAAATIAFLNQQDERKSRDFENHFFVLLGNFQRMIAEIDVVKSGKTSGQGPYEIDRMFAPVEGKLVGRDAVRALLLFLRYSIASPDSYKNSKSIHLHYTKFYNRWHDDLGHYFRTLYHIFRLVDERCHDDKHYYSRIIRAHLSNSELCLLAYNCIVGEGRLKFKKYIKKYAVLHNIHISEGNELAEAELKFFIHHLGPDAFSFEFKAPFSYI